MFLQHFNTYFTCVDGLIVCIKAKRETGDLTMPFVHSKQVRVQLANIQPGLTLHWNSIESHVFVLYLFSHTGHTTYTV